MKIIKILKIVFIISINLLTIFQITCVSLKEKIRQYKHFETPIFRRNSSLSNRNLILQHRYMTPLVHGPGINGVQSIQNSPYMMNSRQDAFGNQNIIVNQGCPCAQNFRCPPCGILSNNYMMQACPCAPFQNCPKCPPISLIHEIASKKVYILIH